MNLLGKISINFSASLREIHVRIASSNTLHVYKKVPPWSVASAPTHFHAMLLMVQFKLCCVAHTQQTYY